MNLLENEDLVERFKKAVTNEDVVACYDMSLKEFEHSVVHDLFKVCYFTFNSSCHSTFFSSNRILSITCVGNVKVHHCIQVGHRDGQDKDLA